MSEKRNRNANFSEEECFDLAILIKKHEKVIECKKTDVTTMKEKENCWEKISDMFNSKSGIRSRSCKELRMKYENIKRNLKRKIASNKMEMMRTGGGVPKIIELTRSEEIVYSMTRLAVDGLPGRFDEDREDIIDIQEAEIFIEENESSEKTTTEKETTSDNNWSKWTPVALRQPLTKELQVKEVSNEAITNSEINAPEEHRKKCFKSKTAKRYQQLPESTSTNALIEAKLELTKLQCIHYNKLIEDIDQQKAERDLKIEILKVDLELKLLELKKEKERNNII